MFQTYAFVHVNDAHPGSGFTSNQPPYIDCLSLISATVLMFPYFHAGHDQLDLFYPSPM